ncbi:MAG: hypothetical protein ACI3W8_07560 [Oscillospiraceae bacterium]
MENKREYSFMYMGQEVKSGSVMMFRGDYFDEHGNRYNKGFWPCTFKYKEGDRFYIEVDGKLYYHKKLNDNSIYHFRVLNGKKIPNPITEDEVKAGTILLILVMAVSAIFKDNILLWIFELAYYFNWSYHKKYDI